MKRKLTNNFHGTEVVTTKTDEELEAIAHRLYTGRATDADRAYRRRIWRKLCGVKLCTCGDEFGRRE